MKRAAASLVLLALLAGSGFAAYRIVIIAQADRLAASDPEHALAWEPRQAQALLMLAERQIQNNQALAAANTARRLLTAEPLQGRAFRILGAAAAQQGDEAKALTFYTIAARRSPRDTQTQVWLANHYLVAGDFDSAIVHIDSLLRTAPEQGKVLLPFLLQRAVDPAFAASLSNRLAQRPAWRPALLSALMKAPDSHAADNVMEALHRARGLNDDEYAAWIDWLQQRGRWGEAYGRWAGHVQTPGGRVPPVYNGQFEQAVSSQGFDWHMTHLPGVSVEFVPDPGAQGLAAHAAFLGREVAKVNLEQALILAPGPYLFSARVRADDLHSDRGLEWSVTCAGQGQPLASSERLQGSFNWRPVTAALVVPAANCPAQWLRLRNPAPPGPAQQVWGDLWFDDVTISSQVVDSRAKQGYSVGVSRN